MWILMTSLLGLVQPALDMQVTGQQARQAQLPILLYVSRSDCTFCRRFETEVLNPLIRSGVVANQVIIRELVSDSRRPITDFSGRSMAPGQLATEYEANLTPTLLFLDAEGCEIVPRITGYLASDYFSYYLETAIAQAAAATCHRKEKPEP